MTNFNNTPIFLFSASERELFTLSNEEIVEGLFADYKSFSHRHEEGIEIPERLLEPRATHAGILFSEGLRLAHTHLELAKKLVLASLFEYSQRAAEWLRNNGMTKELESFIKQVTDFETFKTSERKRLHEDVVIRPVVEEIAYDPGQRVLTF